MGKNGKITYPLLPDPTAPVRLFVISYKIGTQKQTLFNLPKIKTTFIITVGDKI